MKKEVMSYDSNTVYSPVNGTYIALEKVDDAVFSRKMMGDGFAIEPKNGKFLSPVSGELITVFPTKHAYGIKTATNEEVLIHIGIDTVELNGKGFNCKVKQGQKIKTGDVLVDVDLDVIRKAGLKTISMIIITSGTPFNFVKTTDELNALDAVIAFKK